MLNKRYSSARDVEGVVDLERLRSGPETTLERNAVAFFDLTYPTEDIHEALRALSKRFGGQNAPGLILAQSLKGLGKSHVLLLGYHLFASAPHATAWMKRLGYPWAPPANTVVLVHKFTDQALPHDALWSLIGTRLGAGWKTSHPPSLDDFRAALGDRHLVLILDELERGINSIADTARRNQNLGFLQMLSEEANRSARLTVFAAIYDGNIEPGSTLKRPNRVELRFRKPDDRAAVVRHRLFENADSYDKEAARTLIRSYVNTWRRFGVQCSEAYVARMEQCFPLLPELMDLLFERIGQAGGFQGTRGALNLLGAMLDAIGDGAYIMTGAHCKISDRACADRLNDLDPTSALINCAAGNFRDLSKQPFAEPIASAVLLASLVPGGRTAGLGQEELIRHVIAPGDDPNQFHAGLDAFRKFGTYFHEREGRLLFDLEENEYAKVELAAVKYSDEAAEAEITRVWRQEVFRDTRQAVVHTDPDTTKNVVLGLDTREPRFILAPRRLSVPERHALYHGTQLRNQILLLEPRDGRADHLNNADLIAYARRQKAARDLADVPGTGAERRAKFERIEREQSQNIQRVIRAAGLVYVRIETWSETPEDMIFEEENLGSASSKEEVLTFLRTQIYPPTLFVEHLRARRNELFGNRVEQIDRLYRNTLGFPVPLSVGIVAAAVKALVEDKARIAGLQHQRGNFCGEPVQLAEPELNQAVLTRPWPAMPGSEVQHPPVQPAAIPASPFAPPGAASTDGAPATLPGVTIKEIATPPCRGVGELRMELATRLNDLESPIVRSIRFTIYADYRGENLSGLPAAYRGAVTGNGDLVVQLELTLPGPMSKAELEQCCERLPGVQNGSYAARASVEISPATQEVA
jgi:hypothetical protein